MLRPNIATLIAMVVLAAAPLFAQNQPTGNRDKQPPTVAHKVDAQYTSQALAEHLSGSVILRVTVNPEGKPSQLRVMKSLGLGLDISTMEAVKKWEFKPGLINGAPASMEIRVSMNFSDNAVTSEILPAQ